MKKKIFVIISYIILCFNSHLFSIEDNRNLKIGLLAPLSGEYAELGNSLLYSLQLALDEIGDKEVFIIPRDSGFNNKEKMNTAIKDFKSQDIKVIIGPLSNKEFDEVKKHNELLFISPSNIFPEFTNNIISIGISLESQLIALSKFIKKQKKNKTVLLYPNNEYANLIEKKINLLNLKKFKTFKYNPNPEVLTGEIETLTNYSQRKRNLELRKKCMRIKRMSNL